MSSIGQRVEKLKSKETRDCEISDSVEEMLAWPDERGERVNFLLLLNSGVARGARRAATRGIPYLINMGGGSINLISKESEISRSLFVASYRVEQQRRKMYLIKKL